jgi:hypothetical protein
MRQRNTKLLICVGVVLVLLQPGCFFNGGVSTVRSTTGANGTGFLTVVERNGQWEGDGPPPHVGDETEHPLYRYLRKEASYSLFSSAKDYVLSDPYPQQRRRIAAIREIGVVTENGSTRHYYEVEFENRGAGFR